MITDDATGLVFNKCNDGMCFCQIEIMVASFIIVSWHIKIMLYSCLQVSDFFELEFINF